MPLLRRASSKEEGNLVEATDDKHKKPSFLSRLRRRRSTSADRGVTEQNEIRSSGGKDVLVEVSSKQHDHDQTTTSPTARSLTPATAELNIDSRQEQSQQHPADTRETALTKDDVKVLFSGAPHFMLEKGKHGRVYPQVFFPWNNELEISDLQDRRYLKHESFALATQHAHLPIPDEVSWKPGMSHPVKKDGLDTGRRPMFDLGIFEIPNMLSLDGREPGTVGMRWFLELPVSDRLRSAGKLGKHARKYANEDVVSAMSPPSSLETAMLEFAKLGKHAPVQDRLKFIRGDVQASRLVGVRDISYEFIAHRLAEVWQWRDEVVQRGWKFTLLDKQSCEELHQHLFGHMLYEPQGCEARRHDLKFQLEALIRVLTVPGAWLDFSDVQPRFEIGKILWQGPRSAERKWLWIQILLSVELVIREDAALRVGLAQTSPILTITSEEIHRFNKLRNLKVDWDLLVARRLLDLCLVQPVRRTSMEAAPSDLPQDTRTPHDHLPFDAQQGEHHKNHVAIDDWDCVIAPRKPEIMLDGLQRFSANIGWPRSQAIHGALRSKLLHTDQAVSTFWAGVCPNTMDSSTKVSVISREDWDIQTLEAATEHSIGGWLSRTWLAGTVLPGCSTSLLLMSTLLENDPETMSKLGPSVALQHGFLLNGQSWWNKMCIIGRVLAPQAGTLECMGWLSLLNLIAILADGRAVDDGWKKITVEPVLNAGDGVRIHDVDTLGSESSPLGMGHGKIYGTEFTMVTDDIMDTHSMSKFKSLSLELELLESAGNLPQYAASVLFEIARSDTLPTSPVRLSLKHDVYFVTANPCRAPHGHSFAASAAQDHGRAAQHQADGLPAHPLHKSYSYNAMSLFELREAELPNPAARTDPVWVVDAMACPEAEVYIRAWCSQVGRHALVARSTKTCLSCAIRECKALCISVIIRLAAKAYH